jgi:hypothetical protein
MNILEQIVSKKIKRKEERFLLSDLIPFFGNKFISPNVVFSKKEYEVFIKEKKVYEIFDINKIITTVEAKTIPNTMFKGSFTDKNGKYAHIHVECK